MTSNRPRSVPVTLTVAVAVLAAGCASTNPTPSPLATGGGALSASAAASLASTPAPSASAIASSPAASSVPSAVARDRVPSRLDPAATYQPAIDPADFVEAVDNPYWPLVPGTKWTYRSADERTEVAVTSERRTVMGVSTVVVHDQVFADDELMEDTFDWYAQDRAGNVWYFGEDTTSYEDNPAGDHAGSWEAGVDGGQPGVVMLADPMSGDVYRQEFYAGEAEDLALVRRLGTKLKVPAGSYDDVLVTEEWSPLEPDIIELKYYARGVGVIAERGIFGSKELVQLVKVTPPAG
jgi:hypothetical protein